jgi:hypothetical protein
VLLEALAVEVLVTKLVLAVLVHQDKEILVGLEVEMAVAVVLVQAQMVLRQLLLAVMGQMAHRHQLAVLRSLTLEVEAVAQGVLKQEALAVLAVAVLEVAYLLEVLAQPI